MPISKNNSTIVTVQAISQPDHCFMGKFEFDVSTFPSVLLQGRRIKRQNHCRVGQNFAEIAPS